MCSLPGNPYDGHTLHAALQQVEILTQRQPKEVFVDLGYRGATLPAGVKLYHANSNAASVRGLSGTFGDAAPLNQQSGT